MRELEKPDFMGEGGWVDPNFLPVQIRARLSQILRDKRDGGISPEQADVMVDATSELAQLVSTNRPEETAGDRKKSLLKLSDEAGHFIRVINKMHPDARSDLEAHAVQPASGSPNSPFQWPDSARRAYSPTEGLLSQVWDLMVALERTASHAAAAYEIDNRARTAEDAGRALTGFVANVFRQRFGRLPPADQEGWFVEYMGVLGDHLGLTCKARIVRDVITSMR